jgi:N-acetyl-anhydromuramyl-L-alanine amidase AmpD
MARYGGRSLNRHGERDGRAWPDPSAVVQSRLRFDREVPPLLWFQEHLKAHGFDVPQNGQIDEATRASLSAFQMKYRPARYDGVPDAETAALLEVCTQPGGWVLKGADGGWHSYKVPE